ncbi:hypothetical protein H0088_004086 [Salmonella enterica]|nr:hypothetical protein [Salmonella enterica]
MRKSLHQGTKTDLETFKKRLVDAHKECDEQIKASINPYAAIVAMDNKITRIVTFNHPWVNQC